MFRSFAPRVVVLAGMCAALCGCKKMTVAELKAEMSTERPAELDMLNMFVGNWESEGTCDMAMVEGPVPFKGTSEIQWDESKRILTEHGKWQMADMEPMTMYCGWNYDPNDKKFFSVWIGSMGEVGGGMATYDAATRTWHMKSQGHSPMGDTRGSGTMKFVDDNTVEWHMKEYSGLMKVMEMKGTMRKKM